MHALPYSWGFNYKTMKDRMVTSDQHSEVTQFVTVESFWGLVSNIPPVNSIPIQSVYEISRTDIQESDDFMVICLQLTFDRRALFHGTWLTLCLGVLGGDSCHFENIHKIMAKISRKGLEIRLHVHNYTPEMISEIKTFISQKTDVNPI